MYSVEQQALAQLVTAPDLAGAATLARDFRQHLDETEQQATLVRQRLEAHGKSVSVIKNAIMKVGGKGFLLFARLQPETPGKLTAHAYAYEAMEWAGYEMLIRFAERANDPQTVEIARINRDQERSMMERLEANFDVAEETSHRDTPLSAMPSHVQTHLGEAHALESQCVQLFQRCESIAEDSELANVCRQNRADSERHAEALERRLRALDASPSMIKDAALALGGLNWAMFFQAQSDTPAKLAAFAYAVDHLKIAGYELLRRSAVRAKDEETASLSRALLVETRDGAERLAATFDSVAESTLATVAA
jgi:ferritin-like metal-binding protein YciE